MPSVIPPMQPMPPARTGPSSRPSRPIDATVTVVALVLLAPAALYAAWRGAGFLASSVFGETSGEVATEAGFVLAVAPIACWLLALVLGVALIVTRRRAAWVPAMAVVLWLLALLYASEVRG